LVATTWFKVADVVYYLQNLLCPEIGKDALANVRILNFKDGVEFRYVGGARLVKHGPFPVAEGPN
jgi:hypothetical protein